MKNKLSRVYINDNLLSYEEIKKLPDTKKFWYKTLCVSCGEEVHTRCNNKTQECMRCKVSKKMKQLYVDNPNLGKERFVKRTKSNLEKYGVENSFQREECKQKIKQTNLERYGYENPAQSPMIKEKQKQNNLEKYGVEYTFQVKEFKEKTKKTLIKKYGVDHIMKNPIIVNKIKQTCLKKYGKDSYLKTPEYKEKFKNTCLEKYKVNHPMKDYDIQKKSKKKYRYQDIMFDSSWEVALYIYLTDYNYSFEYHPNIYFDYLYEGKTCRYFPDFIINGKLYEIKGLQFFRNKNIQDKMWCPWDHTLDKKFEAKQECMIQNNVTIITNCVKYIKYVNKNYSKNFLSSLAIS